MSALVILMVYETDGSVVVHWGQHFVQLGDMGNAYLFTVSIVQRGVKVRTLIFRIEYLNLSDADTNVTKQID